MKTINVLCIHGIGGKDRLEEQEIWHNDWKNAFVEMEFTHRENVKFMEFDTFFDKQNADLSDYWKFFKKTFRKKVEEEKLVTEWFDNYPDMVVEFLLNKNSIREVLREELEEKIKAENPDIIYAHSLGSMMCYDFFTQPENNTQYKDIILITAGSQLGNPKLRNHDLKQPIEMLPVKFWYNLNNPKDKVFARYPIQLSTDEICFKEVETTFKENFGHDGLIYITNNNAKTQVWGVIKNNY